MKHSFRSIRNFLDETSPIYTGNFSEVKRAKKNNIKIVSWNIRLSENTGQAIEELTNNKILADFDILLLQEMDQESVISISKAFHCQYVYAPATIHLKTNRLFGNAIVSRFELTNPKKITLPYKSYISPHSRLLLSMQSKIYKKMVTLCSVHTELFLLNPSSRKQHRLEVFNKSITDTKYCILGGDFNTLRKKTVQDLTSYARALGFTNISSPHVSTFHISKFHRTLDHMFIKGLTVIDHGVVSTAKASDHFPIWATIRI